MDAVVVMTQFGSSMETFEETFGAELDRLLQARGIRVEVIRTGGLELNPIDPVDKAAEIGASLIFLVGQTESRTITDGGFMNDRTYKFDASLVDITTRRRVWRAEVESKVGTYSGSVSGATKMAEKVVEKLVEDRLLPPPTSA